VEHLESLWLQDQREHHQKHRYEPMTSGIGIKRNVLDHYVTIHLLVDAIVSSGLASVGYTYINIGE
jgi:hypothetical protein